LAIKGGYGSGHLGTKRISARPPRAAKNTISSRDCAHFSRLFVPPLARCENICRKPGNRRCLLDDSSFVSFFLSLSRHTPAAATARVLFIYLCARARGIFNYLLWLRAKSESHSLRAASSISRAACLDRQPNHREQSRREHSEMGHRFGHQHRHSALTHSI
jgi:hypothetical protein